MVWNLPNAVLWGYLVGAGALTGALMFVGTISRTLFQLPGSTDRVAAMMRRMRVFVLVALLDLALGVTLLLVRGWEDPYSWVILASMALTLASPIPILALMGLGTFARTMRGNQAAAAELQQARVALVHGAPFAAALALVALALACALPIVLPLG